MVSEENPEPVVCPDIHGAKYAVVFDPLDGYVLMTSLNPFTAIPLAPLTSLTSFFYDFPYPSTMTSLIIIVHPTSNVT